MFVEIHGNYSPLLVQISPADRDQGVRATAPAHLFIQLIRKQMRLAVFCLLIYPAKPLDRQAKHGKLTLAIQSSRHQAHFGTAHKRMPHFDPVCHRYFIICTTKRFPLSVILRVYPISSISSTR